MRQLDDTLRKAFNLEPSSTTVERARSTSYSKCTIFEDAQRLQKNIIESAWYFQSPLGGQGVVGVDLRRLLKEYDMKQLDVDVRENADTLLHAFSQEVNRLKQRIATNTSSVAHREDDLLSYIVLIGVINRVFDNNSSAYSYVVQSCDNNALDDERCYRIQSDKFLFEYLNSLLALLAHYNNQAIQIGVEREKTVILTTEMKQEMLQREVRLFHMCVELFMEILAQCRAPRATHKLLYKEQLRSLGVDPRTKTIVTSSEHHPQTPNLPLKEFICSFLGGESAIEARMYLCTAKKHEVALLLVNEGSPSPETIVSSMSDIYNAYRKAYELAALHGDGCPSLSNHCRFMAHLWFLRTHLFIVKQASNTLLEALVSRTETNEELTRSKGILARLLYVTLEAKEIAEGSGVFMIERLSAELDESYNALLDELGSLTARFDTEIWKNRQTKESKGLDFSLHPHKAVSKKDISYFNEACKLSHQKYNQEKEPLITNCLKLLRAFHDKLIQEQSEALKKKNLCSSNSSSSSKTQPLESKKKETEKIAPMERSLKIGHFTEREWWLQSLISCYSETEGEFRIDPTLYSEMLSELSAVKEAIRIVTQSK